MPLALSLAPGVLRADDHDLVRALGARNLELEVLHREVIDDIRLPTNLEPCRRELAGDVIARGV